MSIWTHADSDKKPNDGEWVFVFIAGLGFATAQFSKGGFGREHVIFWAPLNSLPLPPGVISADWN